MRPRQLILTGGLVFLGICVITLFRLTPSGTNLSDLKPGPLSHKYGGGKDGSSNAPQPLVLPVPYDPKPMPAPPGSHPIYHLVTQAEQELEATRSRQSKTIKEAVTEYRRRYGIPPPPNFDKWFEFAKAKNVQLIDEFDMIHESLTPFWGLKPFTIRARAREALGFDNALLGVQIRNGKITHIQGGSEWQREAT
ncbi:hypothetical protein PC116_g31731, partial [Phytophthora cactorum]